MKHLPKDGLKWVAAAFALVATATAEYEIARAIGMNGWVAAAVPGALDAYVVRALRAHREVLTAVLAMVAVNAASHLVTAGVIPVDWPLITAVSAIAPLVLWRVHALGTPGQWRERKLWGVHAQPEHACTVCLHEHDGPCTHFAGTSGACTCGHDDEHGRAPDNPEPPGTREHPEHAASTGQERVHAQTDAWGDDWLDVHDAVSTPPVPVHAPYSDHVPGVLDLEVARARREHAANAMGLDGFDPVHAAEHAPDPSCTVEDWNLKHVSTGVLEPEDTEHMERARELFHTIGGVPPFRALKEGTPGMGTPRAKRIRAALVIENEGTD